MQPPTHVRSQHVSHIVSWIYELVNESIHSKLEHMPEASRAKLSETLERIINEGSGGLICILL